MNAHDLIREIIERKGKVENVFWIACGGSMIDLMPANELLKREATTFISTVYTAREFCLMAPKSLGEKSLVIACSHSGNTQEVVDGCEMALAAGAEVIALTDCEGSKIDNGKWTTWVYPWGKGESQAEVPQGIGVLMAAELLDQQEGYEALADMYAGLKQMDALLPAAREKVNAELGDRFAELCQQHKFFYILGSGPNFSQTYAMAICYAHGDAVAALTATSTPASTSTARSRLPSPACSTLCSSDRASVAPWRSARSHSSTRIPIRSWCSMRSSTAWARCPPACVRS